jgi:hypothetical protein
LQGLYRELVGRLKLEQRDRSTSNPDAIHGGKGCLGVLVGVATRAEADFKVCKAIDVCESYGVVDDLFDWRHLSNVGIVRQASLGRYQKFIDCSLCTNDL